MTTARRGITNHEMCESFERCHKHLLTLGYSHQEATRGAVALTAAFSSEYTREQAWEVANAIAPKHQTP